MCSVSCIIHQHSSGLASATPASCPLYLLHRPASTLYTTFRCHDILDIPHSLHPLSFLYFLPLCPSLLPPLHFYPSPLPFIPLSPPPRSIFACTAVLSARSFFYSVPLVNFACHRALCAPGHVYCRRTMSHNFDNSTSGASFMRWSLYRNNFYHEIVL